MTKRRQINQLEEEVTNVLREAKRNCENSGHQFDIADAREAIMPIIERLVREDSSSTSNSGSQ